METPSPTQILGAAALCWSLAAPVSLAAPPAASPAADEHLDSRQAMQAAQAAGLKTSLMVPYAVRCPDVPAPKGDAQKLAARDKLAGLAVDIDAFLRPDMGVAEAAALLGRPALCNRPPPGRYLDMHVAPKLPNVRDASLETRDGELIGLVVAFEKPVPVDLTALEHRYGPSKRGPGPMDAHEAGTDNFNIENGDFKAQVMLSHRAHTDPPTARQVYQIILRRTSQQRLLPEGFRSEKDVVRLLGLALGAAAPDPVDFAGTLGVYNKPANGRVVYGPALPVRNIDSAASEVATRGAISNVRTLTVTFKDPVPCTAAGLAGGLAAALRVPQPTPKGVSGKTSLDIRDGANRPRGTVLLDFSGNALKSVAIERFDNP